MVSLERVSNGATISRRIMREAPKDAGERRIGAWGRHDPGSVRRRRSRRAHGNVGGAGVVVCVFGSGSFGNLAAGRPRRRFRGVAAARSGQKHAMQSAAGRARSGFRRAPRRSGGAHVPIASVVLSPPLSSRRRWSGTTALRQAPPTRSRLAAKSDGRRAHALSHNCQENTSSRVPGRMQGGMPPGT